MKTKNHVCLALLLILYLSILSVDNLYAQQKRTTQEVLMSYDWISDGQENLINISMYFDKKNEYNLVRGSKLWGHEKNDKEGRKPVHYFYYLSDSIESKFDSTKVGKQVEGKYIIRASFLDPVVWEIVDINDEKLVIRWGEDTITWLAKPRKN